MGIAIIVIIFVAVAALVYFLVSKRKSEAWQGEVIDKREKTHSGADDFESTTYYLVVKTDDGKQRDVTLSKKLYDSFAIGDKIVKNAGSYNPTKL